MSDKKINFALAVNEIEHTMLVTCTFTPRDDMTVTVSDKLDIKHLARAPEIMQALEKCVLAICRGNSSDSGIH